jgi:hypothetical protein
MLPALFRRTDMTSTLYRSRLADPTRQSHNP